MKKVAVLVSGGGTNLQALLDRGIRGGEIVRVVSSKEGAYALERARAAGIQTVTVPRKLMSRDEFEEGLMLALEGVDLVVKGVKLTGATVHFVTAETDAGPIIAQKAVEVREDDTPETLQRRVMEEAEWELLPEACSLFCEGRLEVRDGRVFVR